MPNNNLEGPIYLSADLASVNDSTPRYPGLVGKFFEQDGKKYQYIQLDSGAVTAAAGHAVSWIDFDDFKVTNDISDAIGLNVPAGVLMSAVTAGNYGFIQVRGVYPTVLTNGDDDISANDTIIMSSTDGAVNSVAAATAPTHVILGVATAADVDASNTVAVLLCPPLNGA